MIEALKIYIAVTAGILIGMSAVGWLEMIQW